MESVISSAIDKLKTPPCLIANAAGIVKDDFILNMDDKRFMEVLDVNLKVMCMFYDSLLLELSNIFIL